MSQDENRVCNSEASSAVGLRTAFRNYLPRLWCRHPVEWTAAGTLGFLQLENHRDPEGFLLLNMASAMPRAGALFPSVVGNCSTHCSGFLSLPQAPTQLFSLCAVGVPPAVSQVFEQPSPGSQHWTF